MIVKFLNNDFNSIERYLAEASKPYIESIHQDFIKDMMSIFGNYQDAVRYVCFSVTGIEMEFRIIPFVFKFNW